MKTSKDHFRIFCLAATVFFVGIVFETIRVPSPSQAAEQGSDIELVHRAPDIRSLPPGASLMPLVIELRNTKATDLKIHLVAARDGRFMDIMLPSGFLNEVDLPTYQVEIPAPFAELTYHFVIHHPDGSVSTTRRFAVRRPCIQNFDIAVPEDAPDAEFKKEMATLVARAKQLERDTANYETSLKLIDELKLLVKEE